MQLVRGSSWRTDGARAADAAGLASTIHSSVYRKCSVWSQMAERLGNRASNQKVAGSIPGCAK